jgi:DNA modification methylase
MIKNNNLGGSMTKLLLGDCLVEMKKIPNNYVDSIVSDPPA